MNNNEILEGVYQAAYNAHRNTSFVPEKRAEQIYEDFTSEILEDIKDIPDEGKQRYVTNYRKYLFNWLSAKSRCYSVMITGPANFNNSRHEKANRSEDNRWNEFRQWRKRALKAIEKQKEAAKSPQEKEADIWQNVEERIRDAAATIRAIDDWTWRGYSRPLFVSVIVRNVITPAKNGQTQVVNNALALIRQLNDQAKKPIISPKHKVWGLAEAVQKVTDQQTESQTKESKEYPFEGGKMVLNFQEKRIQIFHDQKPEQEKIQELKSLAFKWAPSNKCWQRIYTDNAIYAAKKFLKMI